MVYTAYMVQIRIPWKFGYLYRGAVEGGRQKPLPTFSRSLTTTSVSSVHSAEDEFVVWIYCIVPIHPELRLDFVSAIDYRSP